MLISGYDQHDNNTIILLQTKCFDILPNIEWKNFGHEITVYYLCTYNNLA